MKSIILGALAALSLVGATAANATRTTVYDTVPDGQAAFDATVTGTGGAVSTKELQSGVTDYGDFTISKAPTATYSEITGYLAGIDPDGTTQGPDGDSRASGVTFNFAAPINSFGLNVGDWGTCCLPSALYIAFDGGPAIQVAIATSSSPALLTDGSYAIFAAAFDDTSKFQKIEFWGDGFGEYLVAGGTIRYAAIDIGSLPGVPEPATWAMLILGFGAVGGALRRRKAASTDTAFGLA